MAPPGPASGAAEALAGPSRISVTIAGIRNATGDAALDFWQNGLLWILQDRLSQAGGVCFVPGYQVTAKMGAADARRIGQWVEARRVIWGSYSRHGGNWELVLQIENVATGEVSADLSATSDHWYDVLDRLTNEMLRRLGAHPTPTERREILSHWTSSDTAMELLSKARSELLGQNLPAGESYSQQALEADPSCAEAHALFAGALFSLGRTAEGEREARAALKLKPGCADAHYALGALLQGEQRFAAAERELKAALQRRPADIDTLIRLGDVYEKQRSPRKAARYYEQAVRFAPFNSGAHARLGYHYATQGNRDRALEELKKADQLGNGALINTEQTLFLGYAALNELPAALYHCRESLALAERAGLNADLTESFRQQERELRARLTQHLLNVAPPKDYTPVALRQALRQRLTEKECEQVPHPLTATVEMTNWANHATSSATNDLQKAHMLFDALLKHVQTGPGGTRTAEEAFAAWKQRGTTLWCQEYAYLYVALARAVGLRVYDVSVEESWDGSKELHACAAVFIGRDALLADPAVFWFGAPHKRFEVLDDLQATAVYLAEREDLRDNELAAKIDPESSFVRGNLIMMLVEKGRWEDARRSLAAFVQSGSDPAFAGYLQAHVALHEKHPDKAVELLHNSLQLSPDFGRAHLLLALAYQDLGKLREARQAFRDALSYPIGEADEKRAHKVLAQINEELGDDH